MTSNDLDPTGAAALFFAGARRAGLARVVISPGSRSTPLAIAASRDPELEIAIHLDERTAAFAALGEAKATGVPVALVCTSGTAAANYLPAVAEASLSHVPLVVITADRPPEHLGWGVGQSFDQRGLYQRQVREEFTMPVGASGGAAFYERVGWRATGTATSQTGPVHVNWPFRLPLEPVAAAPTTTFDRRATPGQPVSTASPGEAHLFESDVESLQNFLSQAERPVIIAGPDTVTHRSPRVTGSSQALVDAAASRNVPILADVLSGLWGSSGLVEAPAHVVHRTPLDGVDAVIRVGQTPTNKATRLWWEQLDAPVALIDPRDEWHDPSHNIDLRLTSEPTALLTRAFETTPTARQEHLQEWLDHGAMARERVDRVLLESSSFTEAHVAAAIAQSSPGVVVASSSMPVRDLDMFGSVDHEDLVLANRGINGIDGVVATATGVARAYGQPITVLIGDVAALHDIGSILDAARQHIPLRIVIPNNDGGGIFSMLPIKETILDDEFNRLFHTPHGTSFEFLGALDGVGYEKVTSIEDLSGGLDRPANPDGVSVIEVPVSTPERLEIASALKTALEQP